MEEKLRTEQGIKSRTKKNQGVFLRIQDWIGLDWIGLDIGLGWVGVGVVWEFLCIYPHSLHRAFSFLFCSFSFPFPLFIQTGSLG